MATGILMVYAGPQKLDLIPESSEDGGIRVFSRIPNGSRKEEPEYGV